MQKHDFTNDELGSPRETVFYKWRLVWEPSLERARISIKMISKHVFRLQRLKWSIVFDDQIKFPAATSYGVTKIYKEKN